MSGLILLVIVGAWLAVLVPMALRSHDSGRALSTVDKFHDAMRVLSRRDGLDREPVAEPTPEVEPVARRVAPRVSISTAARRRRVLLVLSGLALVLLAAGVVGPRWLLALHAVADLLLVAYVGYLRHQTVLRAEREWRDALGERVPLQTAAKLPRPAVRPVDVLPAALARPAAARPAAARPAAARPAVSRPAARAAAPASVRYAAPGRIAGIPDRMPARFDRPEVLPVRGAVGEPWAPVPVPLPGYVTAPTAPRRVLDLTRPGEWSDGVAAAERELGIDDQGPELDQILEQRRAAGDW